MSSEGIEENAVMSHDKWVSQMQENLRPHRLEIFSIPCIMCQEFSEGSNMVTLVCKKCQRTCHNCRKTDSEMMQCSKCKIGFYCNKECQTTDWKKHKEFCSCSDEIKRNYIYSFTMKTIAPEVDEHLRQEDDDVAEKKLKVCTNKIVVENLL